MDGKMDSDQLKVFLEGPPIVYIVKESITFFSIGVITSKCAKNNLAKITF